jgi:hypothetical protein
MLTKLTHMVGRFACLKRDTLCKFSTNIELILKNYSNELAQSQIMEKMIPRKFSEAELIQLSSNQRFTNGNNHINSLTKTFS